MFERVVETREEVVLFHYRHEMQPELQGRGFDADANIGNTAGDAQADCNVRVLHVLRVAPQV